MKEKSLLCMSWLAASTALALPALGLRNPVINADCPDPSLVYDGTNYYMVTTTMHLNPGAPVMRSSDLRHWEIVSYVYDTIPGGDEARWNLNAPDGDTYYGQGQWAASLKIHNGKFYCYFVCNRIGGFLYEADCGEGPWRLKSQPGFFHDASLLFDDDGKVYMFGGGGNIDELKEDLSGVKPGGLKMRNVIDYGANGEDALLEGSSVFKYDGWYYLMMISMKWGEGGHLRREVCYRSRTLDNPKWEYKIILETPFEEYGGVGQGCVVEGPKGEWNAIIFQDRGGIGRVPCLMPVRWVDGWPMCGDENGNVPNDPAAPFADVSGVTASDDFGATELALAWQFNHRPDNGAWSLTERPGWLRLSTARTAANIFLAQNTLTQRMVGPRCSGAVKLDVSGMKDGDHAGIVAFNQDAGVLAVVCEDGRKSIVMTSEKAHFGEGRRITNVVTKGSCKAPLKGDEVWLRVNGDFFRGADTCHFEWSENGTEWRRIGERVRTPFNPGGFFMGTKFALFNYATKEAGGHVDFDKFIFSAAEHEQPCAKFSGLELSYPDGVPGAPVILPGMAPDPSITRKGNDYYLANSSFSYFPGIPVWHSTNLKDWDFCGYALNRPEQLPLQEGIGISRGVFAPDIKYNPYNDTFYLIVTLIDSTGNVVYKTKDPAKGWSDPIKVPVGGIDPSFFFEDAKTAWILNNDNAPDDKEEYPGHRTVRMRKYDLEKDEVVPGTEKIIINKGVNPAEKPIWCEGPHLYKIGGAYYVMTAEGGTAQGHCEVMWRAESLEGPYKPCPVNPILTQRDINGSMVTCAGHADLIETPEGEWRAVFLGVIPYRDAKGREWCATGRSTLMLPVEWIGEGEARQPVILEKGKSLDYATTPAPAVAEQPWFQMRTPAVGEDYSAQTLKASPVSIYERGNPACLMKWVRANAFTAGTKVAFAARGENDLAGLVVQQDEQNNYVLGVTKDAILLVKCDKGNRTTARQPLPVLASTDPISLRAEAKNETIRFFWSVDGDNWNQIGGDEDAKILTTDYAGGFVGAAAGIYATSNALR